MEEVGATKRIEALGDIELLTAEDMILGSAGHMSTTTGGNLEEDIALVRRALAGELQHFEAPKSWMGSDGVNIFRLLLQLMNVVEQLAAATAGHTHGSGPAPGNSATMIGQSQQAGQLASQLSPIIE
ncbi:hypothetical protein D3C71_1574960 [compost metagenome]